MLEKKKNKSLKTFIILAAILLLPGFLYILMNKFGHNSYASLPIYGEKIIPGTTHRKWGRDIPDTIFHTLKPISFTNDDGKKVSLLDNDSTLSVVHLMYSRDKSFSNTVLSNMRNISKRFLEQPKVRIFSISVDTLYDTPNVLAQKAKYYTNGDPKWYFVSKPSADIFKYAKESLLLDAMKNNNDSIPFIIGSNYLLVDTKGRIRGIYDINIKTDISRLEDEIKLQLVEEVRNNPPTVLKKN